MRFFKTGGGLLFLVHPVYTLSWFSSRALYDTWPANKVSLFYSILFQSADLWLRWLFSGFQLRQFCW